MPPPLQSPALVPMQSPLNQPQRSPAGLPQKRNLGESETQFDMDLDEGSMLPPPAQQPHSGSSTIHIQGSTSSQRAGTSQATDGFIAPPPARSKSVGSSKASQRDTSERVLKIPRRSRSGSSTPLSTSPKSSPKLGATKGVGSTSLIVPPGAEADLQPHTVTRAEDFTSGRRVFHVHFGHGYVASLETREEEASQSQAEQALSSRTQDINVVFDAPKYTHTMKLRAFYAVPKMVVIPSGTSLGKRKLRQAADSTRAMLALRTQLVSQMLGRGEVRAACGLVQRWQLTHVFEPTQLLQRMLQQKEYTAVFRYAREFGLTEQYPAKALLQRMLEERRYEGALKFVRPGCTSVDGHHSPTDVLAMLVGSGRTDVALKYVHKFGAAARFPPELLVSRCLATEAPLTVRTCSLLLKYVALFQLEALYPPVQLLERVRACGITAHRLNGKYVLKGSRRAAASGATSIPVAKVGSAP